MMSAHDRALAAVEQAEIRKMFASGAAVVGVAMAGMQRTGALCAEHWNALSHQPGLTFFSIRKGKRGCTICVRMKK